MPAIQAYAPTYRTPTLWERFTQKVSDIFSSDSNPPKWITHVPQPPQTQTIEQNFQLALRQFPPVATKSGVNGSFFLCNLDGERAAIFKPMNMEAGGPKNHRLDAAHNVQFRNSILPGQGAGNEVLAYGLDSMAFGHHYGIPQTMLIRLTHPAFEGTELGSLQQFVPHAQSLADMTPADRARIPQHEWEKLNFRFISGSTDAHLGNILYCASSKKLFLIDSGDDFVGEDGECQYYDPWAAEPRCQQKMSHEEYAFLRNLSPRDVICVFEKQALANKALDSRLKVSADKYLTQIIRLMLANTVGKFELTQNEWARIMSPYKDTLNILHRSPLEKIYDQHIRPYSKRYRTWVEAYEVINWERIREDLASVALQIGRPEPLHGRR
ncbi:MAG: hypothetical protein WCK49_04445 [Myxococcaceae bacterium]